MVLPVMAELIDIVSSRVKAEVFRVLFGLNEPELHLRELVRQSGLSLGTVQQELRGLVKSGLVLSRRDGNRLYFRANKSHPAHRELSALVLKTGGLAGVLSKALQVNEITLAFIFGSIARHESRPHSDVDLMVIGSVSLRKLTGLLSGVAEKIGREINPHVMTEREYRERKGAGDHFIRSVLSTPRIFVKGSEDELKAMGG